MNISSRECLDICCRLSPNCSAVQIDHVRRRCALLADSICAEPGGGLSVQTVAHDRHIFHVAMHKCAASLETNFATIRQIQGQQRQKLTDGERAIVDLLGGGG